MANSPEPPTKLYTDFRLTDGIPSWHCYLCPSVAAETGLTVAELVRNLVYRRINLLDPQTQAQRVKTEQHCFKDAVNTHLLDSTRLAHHGLIGKAITLPPSQSTSDLLQLNLRMTGDSLPSVWPTPTPEGYGEVESRHWSNRSVITAVQHWMQAGARAFEPLTPNELASIEESWRGSELTTGTVRDAMRSMRRMPSLRSLLSSVQHHCALTETGVTRQDSQAMESSNTSHQWGSGVADIGPPSSDLASRLAGHGSEWDRTLRF